MTLHNSNLADGKYIGFGGQFYTLWVVWSKDDQGTKQADFLGNISKDLQTAQEKHPDATLSALKGQAWEPYDSVPPIDHSEDQAFWFGRYTGTKFEDCQDDKYMIWFYTETRQHVVRDVLISRGYQLYNGQLYTNEEFEILRYVEDFRNGTHVVEFVSNINETYGISIKLDKGTDMFPYGLTLYISGTLFDQINWLVYNDYRYGTFNGKRTMKKGVWEIETRDGYIMSIKEYVDKDEVSDTQEVMVEELIEHWVDSGISPSRNNPHTQTNYLGRSLGIKGTTKDGLKIEFTSPMSVIAKTQGILNGVGLYKKSPWYKEVKSEMVGHKNLLHYQGSSESSVYIEDKTTVVPTIKIGDTIKIKFTVKQQYPDKVVVNRVKLLNIA